MQRTSLETEPVSPYFSVFYWFTVHSKLFFITRFSLHGNTIQHAVSMEKCSSSSNSKCEECPSTLSLEMTASIESISEGQNSNREAIPGTGSLGSLHTSYLSLYLPSYLTLQTYQNIYRSHIMPISLPTVCHSMLSASPSPALLFILGGLCFPGSSPQRG